VPGATAPIVTLKNSDELRAAMHASGFNLDNINEVCFYHYNSSFLHIITTIWRYCDY